MFSSFILFSGTQLRRSFFAIVLILGFAICSAKQITKDQSLAIAKQFYSEQRTSKFFKVKSATIPDFKLDYIANDAPSAVGGRKLSPAATDSVAYYYIYNVGENQGFVIISGDDRTKPILGYSDEGRFASDNMPENVKYFVNNYRSQIKNLLQNKSNFIAPQKMQAVVSNDSVVAPLILTKWGQLNPYNSKIPLTAAPTGCGATAMAQIMNYHKWPIQGISTHSYTYNGKTYSANFSITKYDWVNMKNEYSTNEDTTSIFCKAVGDLMYHCGVALDMQYDLNGSNTTTDKIPLAFINYFGYDKNVQLIWSKDFTTTQWKYKVKSEINAKRPILIFGKDGSSVGHEYIADGYDTYNFIHINWGWDGNGNGYFETDPLDASIYFTPGSLIIGIQKPVSYSNPTLVYNGFNFSINTSYSRTQSINKTIVISEATGKSFSGIIGLAFYKNEKLYSVINYAASTIVANTTLSKNFTFTIPDTLSVGTYRLVPIFKSTNDSAWSEIKYKYSTTDLRANENVEFDISKSAYIIYQNSKTMNCKKNEFKTNFSFDDWANVQRLVVSGQIDQFDLLYMAAGKSIKSIDIKNADIIPTNINTIELAYSGKPNSFNEFYNSLSSKWKDFRNYFWNGVSYKMQGDPDWKKIDKYYEFKGLSYDVEKNRYFAVYERKQGYDYTYSQVNIYTYGGQGLQIIGGNGIISEAFNNSTVESISLPNNLKYIAPKAFINCPNLKTITIPDSVALIGDSLVYNCPKLISVTFNKQLRDIWSQNFSKSSLTIINLPDSLTSIPDRTFENCGKLTSISLPSSLISIGSRAFSGCSSLKSLKIPESVRFLGDYAFQGCGLIDLSIPSTINSLSEGAFHSCSNLTSIVIPNSVTSIGIDAFAYCSGLTSITIPKSVSIIGVSVYYPVFLGCSSLSTINVDVDNPTYSSVDGVLFNKNKSVIICFPGAKQTEYVIPKSVTTIASSAFSPCNLKSITIPESVISIKTYAFFYCSNLTSIFACSKLPIDLSASSNVFYNINKTTCILNVPTGSKAAYQAAAQWKDFTNIVEFDPTSAPLIHKPNIGIVSNSSNGLLDIKGLENSANISIYNLQGREVLTTTAYPNEPISISSFPRGVYIVKVTSKDGAFVSKFMKE